MMYYSDDFLRRVSADDVLFWWFICVCTIHHPSLIWCLYGLWYHFLRVGDGEIVERLVVGSIPCNLMRWNCRTMNSLHGAVALCTVHGQRLVCFECSLKHSNNPMVYALFRTIDTNISQIKDIWKEENQYPTASRVFIKYMYVYIILHIITLYIKYFDKCNQKSIIYAAAFTVQIIILST